MWLARADEEVLGAALWQAPGSSTSLAPRLRVGPAYLGIFGTRLRLAAHNDREVARLRPKVSHWYLTAPGTSPRARGRGVAPA